MNELYFIGMDIVEESKILLDFEDDIITTGMTDDELSAYRMGVKNTLSALKAMLETENKQFVVHIPGIEIQEEFDIMDLEHYLRII